ncbi:MAG: 4-alpha-glucanotransferase, partial [Gemmataceae bacterium]|nr:4-alpha-glucanotransferase [Gemmataceae bacterium]
MSYATDKESTRSSGILLHPTSLPGPYGIGDLGPAAYAWVDILAQARQKWWQVLPLGLPGFGDSPYQCYSAFAGNAALVSPDLLRDEGLIDHGDLPSTAFPGERVDYGTALRFKNRILARAWENFQCGRAGHLRNDFAEFVEHNDRWLDDFALLMALKEAHAGRSWLQWPREL